MNNGDKPANPLDPNHGLNDCAYPGLTKREHFAAMAMQGYIQNPGTMGNPKPAADFAIAAADALLKALENNNAD